VSDYSVEVKPSARKELEALPDNVLTRVVGKIESLAHAPRPTGSKKLKGHRDIDDAAKLIAITRIAHRRQVCER
jgi:mRNA-degrading endonuclease RelE of RelBE toxin-antitoxin system